MDDAPESEHDPHHSDKVEIVEGLLQALDDMDRINQVVRGSADRSAARAALMAAPFEFSEAQTQYILDMQVHRQTQRGQAELVAELARLRGR